MPSCRKKSVTLIELIIAITLVSVIILGINSISVFSHYHLISSDRRAKLQNDLSYCLDHITKEASKAIGNTIINTDSVVDTTSPSLRVFIDGTSTPNGIRDANDYWIKYSLVTSNLTYCSRCPDKACATCSGTEEVLTSRITAFTPLVNFTKGNYIDVKITGCYDPDGTPNACNTLDNPQVTMQASVNLPSVSTH